MVRPEPTRPTANLPPHLRILLPLGIVALAMATVWLYGRPAAPGLTLLEGEALGTTWSVKLAGGELGREDERRAAAAARERLARVDALMSTWRDDSELARFNAARTSAPIALASETLAVFAVAQAVFEASGGAFDVTVGPLVQAWGFGSAGRRAAPEAAEIEALRARVGARGLVVDPAAGTLAKREPTLEADLSAVAKGYAVDEIARAMVALGHESFLVEVGGELRARGAKPDGSVWRVAIETPAPTAVAERRIHRVVELRDLSMATSGDYRNYYEDEAGRRMSHTIDPRTGQPVEHRLASVTVLHAEAAWADAWATALNVLGPDAGYALAREQGLAAYLIVRDPEARGGDDSLRFETRVTPAFEARLINAADEQREPR